MMSENCGYTSSYELVHVFYNTNVESTGSKKLRKLYKVTFINFVW